MDTADKIGTRITLGDFIRSDNAVRKGISNLPTAEHLANITYTITHLYDPLCDFLKSPLFISSGYRSAALNAVTKGASAKSQHAVGQAMDLDQDGWPGPTNRDVFMALKNHFIFDQLIWEMGDDRAPGWVHVSIRSAGNNRGQILKAVKNEATDSTDYLPWHGPTV